MNDVKKGIFEIGGIEIGRDTKVEDVVSEKMHVYINDDSKPAFASIRSAANRMTFIGGEFAVEYVFFDRKIDQVIMDPFVGDDPGYPDLKYQKVKWDYCCDLLKKAFGKPDTEKENYYISYDFDGGSIGCCQILEGRNEGEGGEIVIVFTN